MYIAGVMLNVSRLLWSCKSCDPSCVCWRSCPDHLCEQREGVITESLKLPRIILQTCEVYENPHGWCTQHVFVFTFPLAEWLCTRECIHRRTWQKSASFHRTWKEPHNRQAGRLQNGTAWDILCARSRCR